MQVATGERGDLRVTLCSTVGGQHRTTGRPADR